MAPLGGTFRTALFSYDSEKLKEVKVVLYQQNNCINTLQNVMDGESTENVIINTDNTAK